jgi:hypothetical protein
MGFFNNLAKLALDVIETPIAIVKDVATMGAQLTDEGKPYTQRKLEDMQDDFDGMKDSLKDADGR